MLHIVEDIDLFDKQFYQDFYEHYPSFLLKGDVLFFEKSNCYGVFKYDIVQNILKNDHIFSSDYYKKVDKIFLGSDGDEHINIKRIILAHLPFLRSEINEKDSLSTKNLLTYLFKKAQHYNKKKINAVDWIINPFVFHNAMSKFGFVDKIPQLNLLSGDDYPAKILAIKEILFQLRTSIKIINPYLTNPSNYASDDFQLIFSELLNNNVYTKDDINKLMTVFLQAGILTTSSLLASCLYYIEHIDKSMSNDKKYINLFINEVLRIHSPLQFVFRRTVRDTIINGVSISAGFLIAVCIGAANMDEDKFPTPNIFNMNRTFKHIAFGTGTHKCAGEKMGLSTSGLFVQTIYNEYYHNGIIAFDKQIINNNTVSFHNIDYLGMSFR